MAGLRQLADAMLKVINDAAFRRLMIVRSTKVAESFTIDDTARLFQYLYAKVANKKSASKPGTQGSVASDGEKRVKKKALVCGISGQDGSYLAQALLQQGYEVWGSSRDAELNTFSNLRRLDILNSVRLVSLNTGDIGGVLGLLRRIRPSEIYSLAGQSSVGLSFDQPNETVDSIVLGTLNLLEGIRLSDLDIRFYNAGSTECFGDTGALRATETSPFRPCSPYAVAKCAAYWMVSTYRRAYGMFACTGILSNHESALRPQRFVTRKIIHAAARVSLGMNADLTLGNVNVERDWGWAPEYVGAMAKMLQRDTPEDYIIATGNSHTLVDFIDTAFRLANADWRKLVHIDKDLFRPTDIITNKVDPSKAASSLGWTATSGMRDVVEKMLIQEVDLIRTSSVNE